MVLRLNLGEIETHNFLKGRERDNLGHSQEKKKELGKGLGHATAWLELEPLIARAREGQSSCPHRHLGGISGS